MRKLTLTSIVLTVVLVAVAALITVRSSCSRNNPMSKAKALLERMDSTYCEELVFPMVIQDLRRVSLLNVYRREDGFTLGDTLTNNMIIFRPELGMRITIYLGLNCWIDLSNLNTANISRYYRGGVLSEVTLHLPRPTLSPVETIHIHEYPLHIRNLDNAGAETAFLREYLIKTAKARFLDESIRDNIMGRAMQSAEDRIRALVEPLFASEGLFVTVRVDFGTTGIAGSEGY